MQHYIYETALKHSKVTKTRLKSIKIVIFWLTLYLLNSHFWRNCTIRKLVDKRKKRREFLATKKYLQKQLFLPNYYIDF